MAPDRKPTPWGVPVPNPVSSGTIELVDVETVRQAEDALARTQERYRQMVENAHEGIWLCDDQQLTTFVNRRMAEMLGHEPSEMVGRPLLDFVVEDDGGPAAGRLKCGTTSRPGSPESVDVRLRRKDGATAWAILSTSPLRGDDGSVEGILILATDITDRKKLEAQLVVADRMSSLGTMAAGVAHEINNPLSYVMSSVSFVAEELGKHVRDVEAAGVDGSELQQALRDACEGCERIRQIVRDLKTFSRGQEDTHGPVSVQRLIESSINMAWNEIRHRARLVKDMGPIPPVDANESRLGQVILNLLINAAQAIPEGAADRNQIRISTSTDAAGNAVVEVRDTGAGIPPDVARRIFDPFFTTKAIGVGTGLGLSICHGIVQSMGGAITFESTVGVGTIFRVVLPPASSAPRVSQAMTAVPPLGRRGRILVIDDEPGICVAARRGLGGEHDVTSFTSAREALARLRAGSSFDLILCDLMMPDMTGMDFHREAVGLSPETADRIVFLTGGAFTPGARAFLAKVPNQRLDKPFELDALRALIRYRLSAQPTEA